mmetsp:Transcript_35154/g.81462  ORF Transcript_35154/g.81462 Transcript_35154/m.81462 type:complete len:234 (-) Transcript_35154:549-1250(-)
MASTRSRSSRRRGSGIWSAQPWPSTATRAGCGGSRTGARSAPQSPLVPTRSRPCLATSTCPSRWPRSSRLRTRCTGTHAVPPPWDVSWLRPRSCLTDRRCPSTSSGAATRAVSPRPGGRVGLVTSAGRGTTWLANSATSVATRSVPRGPGGSTLPVRTMGPSCSTAATSSVATAPRRSGIAITGWSAPMRVTLMGSALALRLFARFRAVEAPPRRWRAQVRATATVQAPSRVG